MIEKFDENIFITRPVAPDKEKILALFSDVIDSGWYTNMGKQHELFEKEIADYLNIENVLVFNNGTIALVTALKALALPKGSEVITTPFTFAATPHSIAWNNLNPVFVDIDPGTMTLSVDAIEKAITPNTSAILAVHVYGFPCDVEGIEKLSKKYGLKVIYDGAHAFTTEINGRSICEWGDVTMLSFHSTKLFNSIEGGALAFNDPALSQKIYELRNFGIKKINDPKNIKEGIKTKDFIVEIGINGKMNEFQAAWGRETLKVVKNEQDKRKQISTIYKKGLATIEYITTPNMPKNTTDSMQYFPILISDDSPISRDGLYEKLLEYQIYSRKYFYPLCSDFRCYKHLASSQKENLPISHQVSNNILCLPFYGDLLENQKAEKICKIVKSLF